MLVSYNFFKESKLIAKLPITLPQRANQIFSELICKIYESLPTFFLCQRSDQAKTGKNTHTTIDPKNEIPFH